VAAIFGSSIVAAGIVWLFWASCRRRWTRHLVGAGAAAFFAVLMFYSFVVQEDYQRECSHQRQLFTEIMQLTPDAGPGTLLVIQRPWLIETLFPAGRRQPSINSQPQGMIVGFSRLFDAYPGPKVFVVYNDEWRSHLGSHADGKLYWTAPDFGGSQPDMAAAVERVILLVEQPDGNLKRVDTPFVVEGRQLMQEPVTGKRPPSGWRALRRSPLWPVEFPPDAF
jgi:hypothetical protein